MLLKAPPVEAPPAEDTLKPAEDDLPDGRHVRPHEQQPLDPVAGVKGQVPPFLPNSSAVSQSASTERLRAAPPQQLQPHAMGKYYL